MSIIEAAERVRKARGILEPLISGDKALMHPADPGYPEIRDVVNRLIELDYERQILLQRTRSLHR